MYTYTVGAAYTGPVHDDQYRAVGWVERARVEQEAVRGCFQHLTLAGGAHATVRVLPDPEPLILFKGAVHVSAVSVSTGTDRHVDQVILRSVTVDPEGAAALQLTGRDLGQETFRVFCRPNGQYGDACWRSVTESMTRAEFEAWSGLPERLGFASGSWAGNVVRYLDSVIAMDPAMFRDPAMFPALANVPSTVVPARV